jgi:siroheme synthase-like protein
MVAHEPRFGYPVVLDLHDVAVLVVGGGPIGVRKAEGLAAAGARVRLVATELRATVDPATVSEVRERPFRAEDLHGVRLVVTATGDEATDRTIAATARAAGVWVNAADQPDDCDFILPAVARRARVSVAVSTDGASPALARRLRDRCAELLTPAVGDLAEALAAERRAMRTAGASTEDVDWSGRIDPVVAPATSPSDR